MCGICGALAFARGGRVNGGVLSSMNDALTHRGPDDAGQFVDGPVGLAMRRLSIIDLAGGHQPIQNETGSITIVFNGEIYNYRELRAELLARGHVLRTHSDTEVIVHLYEDFGVDCVSRLDGMFAFAIWDANERRLYAARDRLGEKPLVYYRDADKLLLGSEIKAILRHPDVDRAVDPVAMDQYFTYLSVPSPATIYRRIRKLPSGHWMTCDLSGDVKVHAYWDVPADTAESAGRSEQSIQEEIHERLRDAVRERLIADVPLGAFLSGGLDSSLIVALMSKMSPEPVRTFAVGFEGPGYFDEREHARAVAQHCRTDHHEVTVRPNVRDDLPRLVWHWDEPFAVSSAVPTYYLARAARSQVKVVLTGDGSDEVFAGYPRYGWDRAADRLGGLVPRGFLRSGAAVLNAATGLNGLPARRVLRRAAKFLATTALSPDERYARYLTHFDAAGKRAMYSEATIAALDGAALDQVAVVASHYDGYGGVDALNRRLYADLKASLADEMLTKVDRMTMAVGLEARAPFVDHQLVEAASRAPGRMKLRGGDSKYVLKRIAEAYLPASIVHRKKHGFEVPLGYWLRTELRDVLRDHVDPTRLRRQGLLDPVGVQRLLAAHEAGRIDAGHRLWAILMLQVWWDSAEADQKGRVLQLS